MTTGLLFNETMLSGYFDAPTLARARQCVDKGHVTIVHAVSGDETEQTLWAQVMGQRRRVYDVDITVTRTSRGIFLHGDCDCYVGYHCKHIAATLLAAAAAPLSLETVVASSSEDDKDNGVAAITRWCEQTAARTPTITTITPHKVTVKKTVRHHVVYVVHRTHTYALEVQVMLCRVLQKGGYGKPRAYDFHTPSLQAHVQSSDEPILMALPFLNRTHAASLYHPTHPTFLLDGRDSARWLTAMVDTGRCFFERTQTPPLTLGPAQPLTQHWVVRPDATQVLQWHVGGTPAELLLLDTVCYVARETRQMGVAQTPLARAAIEHLLTLPPVPLSMVAAVTTHLTDTLPTAACQLPRSLNTPILQTGITPIPEMRLDVTTVPLRGPYATLSTIDIPTMQITFDYAGQRMPFMLTPTPDTRTYVKDGTVYTLHRDKVAEKRLLRALAPYFALTPHAGHETQGAALLAITSLATEDDYSACVQHALPQLRAMGWRITCAHDAFTVIISADDVAWYSELDETSAFDYFRCNLGVVVDDTRVNLLPVMVALLATGATYQAGDTLLLPLPNHTTLSVPYARIQPMLTTLMELHDRALNDQGQLVLPTYQAELLMDMQAALGASRLRWHGGEALKSLAERLGHVKALARVNIPKAFKGTLRPYQRTGVDWLQFLREYRLGGVLADDMGLGKTVQILAHLCIEKQAKRLHAPVLIVAPTSVLRNWQQEAARFAPHLRTLVFHGERRHRQAATLTQHEMVLTTYALLLRDKALLLDHTFSTIILDEAQCVKNHRAKTAQIVQQLKATHRVCVTGTPLENHLGELWSLFHFLMPGFLGDASQFKQHFRTPIEKQHDARCRERLIQRIKPFLLRRQKNQVLTELPAKTHMVRTVTLQGPERDLYESIRLAMEKKVREAIGQKGFGRSRIVILDALLKLRQVCCHPKLLTLKAAKKAHATASKLAQLNTLLSSLLEEGRRVLIFSQFTRMLAIIEDSLKAANIPYVILTGATKNRVAPVEAFQQGQVPVFLISLKAGGTGLNLTAADTVIHYDPWWNPAVEDQATDRAHRIGQDKPVFVYKLIAEGTVEETIQAMQTKKRDLVAGLFSEQATSTFNLSTEDVQALFKPLSD